MGGSGSGRRWPIKETADGYLCLDINVLRRRGRWKSMHGMTTWSRGGVTTGRRRFTVGPHEILVYRDTDAGESVQRLPITQVPVNWGARYYFCCPRCGRRVAKLYARSEFFCRHCYEFTYESSQQSHARFFSLLGMTDKEYRNFLKTVEYTRELKGKKRIGARMLRRLKRYIERSGRGARGDR